MFPRTTQVLATRARGQALGAVAPTLFLQSLGGKNG